MSQSTLGEAADSRNNTHYSHNTRSFNHTHSFNTANSFNTTHSFNNNDIVLNVNNIGATDERSEILAWLSPLEPRIRHQDIRSRRADNVGQGLLQTEEFQKWCDGPQEAGFEYATLFCCGDPAVGKTYFSSLVVDRLCDKAKGQNIAVACFYLDFAAREEQSATNMLGSLLKQIVGGLERIPEEIGRTFHDYKRVIGGRGLRVPEIVKMLQAVTSLQRTFICVDALDECVEAHRPELLGSLRQILMRCPNTRVFLTGRHHIRGEVARYLAGRVTILYIKPNHDDIVGYIRMRLGRDTSLDAMDNGLEAEIIKTIAKNIPETFLLVSLTIDAILAEPTAYGRRQKLGAVTDGLDLEGVYGATLERIKNQGGEKTRLGMAALMWISHSERLLQLHELLHALAVEIGSTDINPERVPSVEALLNCCLGLVVVDREVSTVRLIHFTLQEHLYTRPDLFGAAHSVMAETCLTYLNFRTINETPLTLFALSQSATFLKYSSLYWGAHAKRQASRDVVSLALKLLSHIESHISTKLLLADLIPTTGRYNGDIPINGPAIGFTGLHCASVLGLVEVATAVMSQPNCDLNGSDFLGITPLIWAAICGREQVVKLLLEQRTVVPDKPDNYFRRTALSWAAGKGHEGTVMLLLGRASSKLDGTDGWWGKTPRVMNKALGKRCVNPNKPDKYGQTPISLAAEEGHEGVVKLLLGRKDVRPDVTDGYGRTPLFWASNKGREGVVKLLLDRGDVNVDRPDMNGQTLLWSAAESGYEGVVGLLLGRKGIDPNARTGAGGTSLSLASGRGHVGVVELLLGREDVNPDKPDNLYGRTPLSWAAGKGHDGVVKLLLGREDVNPDKPDNLYGQTPLSRAAEKGHGGVVKLLLGREDVNPDKPDNRGQTPLSWAAEMGHDGVVKLLLGREDVNPDKPDNRYGQTPLSWAAEKGHDGGVKLLLGREDVNPDKPDYHGQTPLAWAAGNGRDGVVKLLLGREDVNPDKPDNLYGQTPLSRAAEKGHDGVVKLLLGREDVNPNTPDGTGQTPLWWAAHKGNGGVVKLLLEREDINPGIPNDFGQTPLSQAAANCHRGVVKLLETHQSANPRTTPALAGNNLSNP